VVCPEHKTHPVEVRWARERSRFTLLFEALVMAMVAMPVASVAAAHRRDRHADVADRAPLRGSGGRCAGPLRVQRVGIDETSS
jgi:hypothetical protein